MKPDDFEQKIQRQPLRQIPGGWRGEILSAAKSASCPVPRASFLSTLNHQLSTLLWPHPKAWAGLAAVWVLIFALDFSMRDKSPVVAEKSAPPSPEVIVELKQQQRMLAELIGARETHDAEPQQFFPRPRSECAGILMT
jgi:hypothetical protein